MKLRFALLLTLMFVGTGMGQVLPGELFEPAYIFELVTEGTVEMDVGQAKLSPVTFYDRSRDTPNGLGVTGTPNVPGFDHTSTIRIIPLTEAQGWVVTPFSGGFATQSGQQVTFDVEILPTQQATQALYPFEINITTTDPSGNVHYVSQTLAGYTSGLDAFSAQATSSPKLGPDEVGTALIRLSNAGSLVSREFSFREANNPCGFGVSAQTVALAARSVEEVTLSLVAPNDKFWYNSQSCLLQLEVFPANAPTNTKTVTIVATVNGFYVNPDHVITAFWIIAVLVILILIVLARKARIEEEILGKPQAPWTIPAEKVYLAHLKQRDRRAWYIVRHYLMVEEHKSALLWYTAYKRATKGERRRERIIVQHEHVYDRFEAKWAKRMEAPIKKADRNQRKLEKKVARAMRKSHKKDLRAYKKSVRAVEKAHDKKVKKATKKWAKLARKASKKGAEAPPQPHFDAPVHAEPPTAKPYEFEDHKLALKEAKFRLRMEKKQLALQAKHAKQEAKLKAKVRRKVEKLARKLDDPSFIDSLDVLKD
ncbi:MAG: hypothetical protein ACPHK8_06930 [Thermoplasmatota archaeon]